MSDPTPATRAAPPRAAATTPDPTRTAPSTANRVVIGSHPKQPTRTAHVGLAADASGPHDPSGLGLSSVALYGEIGAGVLALLLAGGAVVLWRRDRGTDG